MSSIVQTTCPVCLGSKVLCHFCQCTGLALLDLPEFEDENGPRISLRGNTGTHRSHAPLFDVDSNAAPWYSRWAR